MTAAVANEEFSVHVQTKRGGLGPVWETECRQPEREKNEQQLGEQRVGKALSI